MKRAILSAAVFIFAAALHAQPTPSIAGTWQGTLTFPNSNNTVRLALTIKQSPEGSLRGGFKYVDSDFGIVFSSIAFAAPNLDFTVEATGMAYHGQLSADGKSIAGTMTLGKLPLPLTLSLATPDTLWKKAAGPAPMAANADPAFDVATIKPAPPNEIHPNIYVSAAGLHATGFSAGELIKLVYKIRGRQIINMAPWVADSKFDIDAKSDTPGAPSDAQIVIMVRKLLVERFHFAGHTGTQDYPALVMTLNPKGPQPTPSDPDFTLHGGMYGHSDGGDYLLKLSGADMTFFAKILMDRYRDKQVVDQTGLTGAYDISLRLPAAAMQGIGDKGPEEETGSDYISAAEHAGFKFTSKKVPLPVVIIDHIDPPTPN
jgi:uncharacterized protein (TIGR03435 family)